MFSTTDIFGRIVTLSSDTWQNHICIRHPEVEPYLGEIQQTIEEPCLVTKSSSEPNSQLYFDRPLRRDLYIKVVVDINDSNTGDVATALLQKKLADADTQGGVLYVNKK